jgi:hypothetical protein
MLGRAKRVRIDKVNTLIVDGAGKKKSIEACIASSTRAFFSFISVSVGAPSLMTATPPTGLARRSWSFSRS